MHIPDGYLGPQTYGVMYGAMVPLWALASRIVRRTLQQRHVPFMALGAAFVFVIMMFNIPIPGGSTGHAVGVISFLDLNTGIGHSGASPPNKV